MRVKLLHMKQLNTALKTATSSRSVSILSSDCWWEMCSSGNRTRSVRPGGKYRSIRHTKNSEIQPGNFNLVEWNAPTISLYSSPLSVHPQRHYQPLWFTTKFSPILIGLNRSRDAIVFIGGETLSALIVLRFLLV